MRMCSWLHMSIVDVCTVEACKNSCLTCYCDCSPFASRFFRDSNRREFAEHLA